MADKKIHQGLVPFSSQNIMIYILTYSTHTLQRDVYYAPLTFLSRYRHLSCSQTC